MERFFIGEVSTGNAFVADGGGVVSQCGRAERDRAAADVGWDVKFVSDWRAAEDAAADEAVSSGNDENDEVDDQKFNGCEPDRRKDEDVLSLCRCPCASRCRSTSHGCTARLASSTRPSRR